MVQQDDPLLVLQDTLEEGPQVEPEMVLLSPGRVRVPPNDVRGLFSPSQISDDETPCDGDEDALKKVSGVSRWSPAMTKSPGDRGNSFPSDEDTKNERRPDIVAGPKTKGELFGRDDHLPVASSKAKGRSKRVSRRSRDLRTKTRDSLSIAENPGLFSSPTPRMVQKGVVASFQDAISPLTVDSRHASLRSPAFWKRISKKKDVARHPTTPSRGGAGTKPTTAKLAALAKGNDDSLSIDTDAILDYLLNDSFSLAAGQSVLTAPANTSPTKNHVKTVEDDAREDVSGSFFLSSSNIRIEAPERLSFGDISGYSGDCSACMEDSIEDDDDAESNCSQYSSSESNGNDT